MTGFKINRLSLKNDGRSAAEATLSRMRVVIADRIVTEWESEFEQGGETIELPSYYLAEWLAENWWPLLWEPRKSEDIADSADFLARHSVLTAQQGFALPKILLVPQGQQLSVACQARFVQFAECKFRNGATAVLPRKDVESEMRKFVSGVVALLVKNSVLETDLQGEWAMISDVADDEVEFCQLLGALGLSPFAAPDSIAALLEAAGERHPFASLLDLCQSSTPAALEASLALADKAKELTANAPEAEFEPLFRRSPPADNFSGPGWRHGVNAAKAARAALSINEGDPEGSSKLFDLLKIDLSAGGEDVGQGAGSNQPTIDVGESGTIVGAVERDETRSKIALLQRARPQRKFTAARAAYLAWTSETAHTSRLMTTAVTRDQQASRAFAAELTAPISYIRRHATGRKLTQDDVYSLSNRLGIAPDVVRKQATNNNISIGR